MTVHSTAGTAFSALPAVAPDMAHPYWTFERVADALGTGPRMPNPLSGVCTDTRRLSRGDVFVALCGEHFDAHDFLSAARDAGAAAVVVSDASKAAGLGVPTYVVDDTLVALGALATAWRRAWGRTVIAVAGSNGKTSTKELLKAAFHQTFVVHATAGNLNNRIGVPLTLLGIPSDAEVAVIEIGTNTPGEVAILRTITEPDIAVLTSIGEEHLEGLGDLAGVLREECDVFHRATLAVLPAIYPDAVAITKDRAQVVLTVGLSEGGMSPTAWGLEDDGRPWLLIDDTRFVLPLRGAHHAVNALLAVATAQSCGVPLADAALGMANMPVPSMRGEWQQHGDAILINDAYNANPASMRAALALLTSVGAGRQRVAFLGTMRELGVHADRQHLEVARAALASGAELIAGVGEFAVALAALAPDDPRVVHAADVESVWALLVPRLSKNAIVLLKASRGMQLERVVPHFVSWATA